MIDHAHRGTTDHFFVERIARNNTFTMETSHMHDEYELYYLIEGSGVYHIDGKEFPIKKGNLVVLNKNLSYIKNRTSSRTVDQISQFVDKWRPYDTWVIVL